MNIKARRTRSSIATKAGENNIVNNNLFNCNALRMTMFKFKIQF
jgi:hypothetical protein